MTQQISRRDRIEGAVWGHLVGDAIGVPYEFSKPSQIPQGEPRLMAPPESFDRAHLGTPPGTWSDDGAQMLAHLDALLSVPEGERLGSAWTPLRESLTGWLFQGKWAVDGRVFDCGAATSQALQGIRRGKPDADPESLGNGSLMRVLPLALMRYPQVDHVLRAAHSQSLITHPHPLSQVCCALYTLWVRTLMGGHDPKRAWFFSERVLEAMYQEMGAEQFLPHLETVQTWTQPLRGRGHVVDCLLSARKCVVETDSYESAVRAAVQMGHDTDTTACVAGGAAGALYGIGSVPAEWLGSLRGKELAAPLVERAAREWGG